MDTPARKSWALPLYIAALVLPVIIRVLALPLHMDIVLALLVPLAGLVVLPAAILVLFFANFRRNGSVTISHITAATLIFWSWLLILIMHMHVNY